MKLKHKMADEAFWKRYPTGAMTMVRETWPTGYVAGFEAARAMAAREAVFTGLVCTNLDTIIEQIGEEEVE